MKNKKLVVLAVLFVSLFLIIGCKTKRNEYFIYIEEISVFNQDNEKLNDEMLYHPDATLYINNVTNGLQPINSAYPPFYYSCINLEDSMSIVIKIKCKVTEGYSIKRFPFINYSKDVEINFSSIEEENGSYICTYYMDELPTQNTLYHTSYPRLVNSTGYETSCTVYPNESITNKYLEGIIFKVDEKYSILKEEVEYLNENLTTEFKLYQSASNIKDVIYSKAYYSYSNLLYNKNNYNIKDFKKYQSNVYLYYNMELYTFKAYINDSYIQNYIRRIDVSDSSTQVFGLSINSSYGRVLSVLTDIGLVEVENSTNNSLEFKSPNEAFYIYFAYDNSLNKFTSFSIYTGVDFNFK